MNFESVFKLLLENFKKYSIDAALIGGFAMHTAGHTRATQDIDFLINQEDAAKVKKVMLSLGYDLLHESPDVSNFIGKMKELGKVDFLHAQRQYTKAILARAKYEKILNDRFQIKVIIPEDIIGLKVQSSSNDPQRFHQDMADIESLIKVNYNKLNFDWIREYFALFKREEELKEILKKVQHADQTGKKRNP